MRIEFKCEWSQAGLVFGSFALLWFWYSQFTCNWTGTNDERWTPSFYVCLNVKLFEKRKHVWISLGNKCTPQLYFVSEKSLRKRLIACLLPYNHTSVRQRNQTVSHARYAELAMLWPNWEFTKKCYKRGKNVSQSVWVFFVRCLSDSHEKLNKSISIALRSEGLLA